MHACHAVKVMLTLTSLDHICLYIYCNYSYVCQALLSSYSYIHIFFYTCMYSNVCVHVYLPSVLGLENWKRFVLKTLIP